MNEPRPLQELDSREVGRHTDTVLSEILESDEEAFRARCLYRVTEGEKVISQDEITERVARSTTTRHAQRLP